MADEPNIFEGVATEPLSTSGFAVDAADIHKADFAVNDSTFGTLRMLNPWSDKGAMARESFRNTVAEGLDFGVLGFAQRNLREGYEAVSALVRDDADSTRMLDEKSFNTSIYFRPGMKYREGMREFELKVAAEMHDESEYRKAMAEASPNYGAGAANFVGSILTMALDPLNYVPIFGAENMAAKTAVGTILKSAALTGVETAIQSGAMAAITASEREDRGQVFTPIEIAAEMTGAFAMGFGIRGVHTAWKLGPDIRSEFNRVLAAKAEGLANGDGFTSDPMQHANISTTAQTVSHFADGENVGHMDFTPPKSPAEVDRQAFESVIKEADSGYAEMKQSQVDAVAEAEKLIQERKVLAESEEIQIGQKEQPHPAVKEAVDSMQSHEAAIEEVKRRCF